MKSSKITFSPSKIKAAIISAIAFIFILVISIVIILIPKPHQIVDNPNGTKTFISGNFKVNFNYPAELGNPTVTFPAAAFGNEEIMFSNGLTISYWRFEGFYGPYSTTENLKSRNEKDEEYRKNKCPQRSLSVGT